MNNLSGTGGKASEDASTPIGVVLVRSFFSPSFLWAIHILPGVMKRRFQRVLKLDPIFIPPFLMILKTITY